MRKSCLHPSLAIIFFAALPLACSDSGGQQAVSSGGASGTGGSGSGGSTTSGGNGGAPASSGGSSGSGGTVTGGTTGSGGAGAGGASGGSSGSGGTTAGSGGSARGGAGGGSGGSAGNGAGGTTVGAGGAGAGGVGGGAAGGAGGTSPGGAGGASTGAGGGAGGSQADASDVGGGNTGGSNKDTGGGDPFAADGKVAQNGNRWTITMGTVILEVGTDNAGMVTGFSIDGTNFLVINQSSNGSVFWTAPQSDWDWPPPTEMDTAAYTPTSANNVLTMAGPVGSTDNLSITKKFWGNVANQAVTIEYTIKNNGTAAVKKAPWEITRVYPGGLTVFPNSEDPIVLPGTSNSFLAVPFTTAAGAAWWAYKKAQFTQDIKGGANDSEGWAAQINCGSGLEQACPTSGASAGKSIILIKEWKPTTTVAPSEKEVEIYANAGHNYVEFEQQGDYQSIPAGGTITWTMHWLLRYLPSTVAPTSGSADLLTWIRSQLL